MDYFECFCEQKLIFFAGEKDNTLIFFFDKKTDLICMK